MTTATSSDQVTLVSVQGVDSRVLVCRCGTLADVFIVVTARYVVIIDTLLNGATARALLGIAREYVSNGRQLLVLNTHSHWDHAWGNHVFAGPNAEYPALIIGTRRCAELLASNETRQKLDRMRVEQPGRFDDVHFVPPTVRFDERLTIDGGDLTLDLFLTPGHAPDHVAIFIPEIRTLLAGDAAEFPFPLVDTAATLPLLRASLRHMLALDPAMVLYCHAPNISDPALLAANSAYFDTLEARCRAALQRGAVLTPDADLEALAGFAFEEAIPHGYTREVDEAFYRTAHRNALRVMLEWLGQVDNGHTETA